MEREPLVYYMFVASNLLAEEGIIPADTLIIELLKKQYWLMGSTALYRRLIKAGDRVLFYAAGGKSKFVGAATISTKCIPLYRQRVHLPWVELEYLFSSPYWVGVTDVELLDPQVPVVEILDELSFSKAQRVARWGVYFRNSMRRITEADYNVVLLKGKRYIKNTKPQQ